MRVRWIVPGALDQPTGGYIYDRLVVEHLRALGDDVVVGECNEPDVIVGDGLSIPELARVFAEAAHVPRVLLVHHLGSWELERTDVAELQELEARTLEASDVVIATSRRTAARLTAEYPNAPVPAVVTPGANRLPLLPRDARPQAGLALLCVGSLIPRKRISLVLDALPEDATLSIVGDASRDRSHAKAIHERIHASIDLERRVTLHGVLDDARLAEQMARADALILASSLEGYGMVITEALRAGLPVVVANAAGEAVDVKDDALITFSDAAELRATLARSEHIRSLQPCTRVRGWHEAGDEFRALLTRAIDARGPAPGASSDA